MTYDKRRFLKEFCGTTPERLKHGFFIDKQGNDIILTHKPSECLDELNVKVKNWVNKNTPKRPPGSLAGVDDIKERLAITLTPEKKYKREVIIRIGKGKETEAAAKFLRERYTQEGKQVFAGVYDVRLEETVHNFVFSEDHKDISRKMVAITDDTRITVIGHGTADSNGLRVGTLSDKQVAKVLFRNFFGSDEATVGKISVLSCNNNMNAKEASVSFGVELMNELQTKHVTVVNGITTRVGIVQVGENGRKFYSNGGGTVQTRDTSQVKVKMDSGKAEYLTMDSNNNLLWTDDLPQKAQKFLIKTNFDGDDNISDPPVRERIMQIADQELSGALDGQTPLYLSESSEVPNDGRAYMKPIDETNEKFSEGDSLSVQGSFMELENKDWEKSLSSALDEVNMDKDWIPLINTARTDSDGNSKIMMFNEETSETKSITIKSKAFTQYKQRVEKYQISADKFHTFSRTSIGMTGTGGILDVGGFIYSAIQMTRSKSCKINITCSDTGTDSRLAKALEAYAYIGITEGGFGIVSDTVHIVELITEYKASKAAVNQVETISKSTSKFLKFSKVFGNIGMGVGSVGGIISLGFDAYQLHFATGDERKEYIVQVTIDSVELAANIAEVVGILASASAITSVAGPLGFALTVVGFMITSITSLILETKRTLREAQEVGKYFQKLNTMCLRGGIEFNNSDGVLSFMQHAIVKEIDLESKFLLFDSQYIYRSTKRRNHFPRKVMDKHQAINIRHGIGCSQDRQILPSSSIKVLVLPILPKSYIDYEYGKFPFSTRRHDPGFDIIRRLERQHKFLFSFYHFPVHRIICSISHEYVKTSITVRLARETHSVFVPKIPDDSKRLLENKYEYILYTSAKRHTVSFTDGLSLVLNSSGGCTWILHSDIIDFNRVEFPVRGEIAFGKTNIIEKSNNNLLILTDKTGGQLMVDPQNGTKELMHITQTGSMTANDVKKYLKSMDTQWLQMQKFVSISNYTVGGNFIGNAYYIVKQKEIVYTDFKDINISHQFKESVQLLAHVDGYSYFMGKEKNTVVIWQTDPRSKKVNLTYHLYCGNEGFEVSKVMVQEKRVVLMQNVFNVSLLYMIHHDTIMLTGIDGKENDIYQLGEACFPSLNEYIPRPFLSLSVHISDQFPGTCVYASTIPVLPVVQQVGDTGRHFWLYMEESTDRPTPLPGSTCPASKPPRAKGIITPNITSECADLTLRDIQELNKDTPVYYFFCEKDKQLFHQVGDTAASEVFVPGGISRIDDYGGPKLIVSSKGGIYKFTKVGNVSLAALSFESIALQKQWKATFQNISKEVLMETFLPTVDMNTVSNTSLTAWFDSAEDRLVIVSPSMTAKNVSFVGPSPLPHLVWLYSKERQQVILQEVLDDQEIEQLINRTGKKAVWGSETLPSMRIALNDASSAEYMNGGVFTVTTKGVKLHLNHFMIIKLLGVNSTWISSHFDDIDISILSLCQEYGSSDLITCGLNESEGSHMIHHWYHCGLKKWISTETTIDSKPVYLGANLAEQSLYFFDDNQILQYVASDEGTVSEDSHTQSSTAGKHLTIAESAVSLGQSLTVHAKMNSKLKTIPKLDSMNTLVLSTSSGSKINIEADTWLHYPTIYVTSIGTKGSQVSSLTIHSPDHCLHIIDEFGNNTVIYDPISPRTIILEDFTSEIIEFDWNGLPVNNSAVLQVQLCEQDPILLITKRPRFEASIKTEKPAKSGSIIPLVIIFLDVVCALSILAACWLWKRSKTGAGRKNVHDNSPLLKAGDCRTADYVVKYKTFK